MSKQFLGDEQENQGVPASPSGHQPSASATSADAPASSQSGVPNAKKRFIISGELHAVDFADKTVSLRFKELPAIKAGRYALIRHCDLLEIMGEVDKLHRATERLRRAGQLASARIAELEVEMERRDRNETRNCINWGPCSRHDGRMATAEDAALDAELVGCVRDTAKATTGGNCAFADDDVMLLARLARRAILAGLIDGFDRITTRRLEVKRDEFTNALASGMSASGQDAQRLEAKPASPAPEGGDAQ